MAHSPRKGAHNLILKIGYWTGKTNAVVAVLGAVRGRVIVLLLLLRFTSRDYGGGGAGRMGRTLGERGIPGIRVSVVLSV